MRAAFLGKGGSGKSTISAAVALSCAKQSVVLAIDADVNAHLQGVLGISGKPVLLGEKFKEIAQYVAGARNDLSINHMIGTTPPALASRFIRVSKDDPFLKSNTLNSGNLSLLTVGSYSENDISKTCYHGKLNALELTLHHLLDSKEDVVIADMTAGVDSLGTSLFMAYDILFFIVEPTLKSVKVYTDFLEKSAAFGLDVRVIANKIHKESDRVFLESQIPKERIVAWFSASDDVVAVEQGDSKGMARFVESQKNSLEEIRSVMQSKSRDWGVYYARLLECHKRMAQSWYDTQYGEPVSAQRDPEFTYEKVM